MKTECRSKVYYAILLSVLLAAVFAIGGDGKLTPVEHVPTQGKTPRGFNLDPSGNYLIAGNQDSDNIVVFKVDAKTGKLSSTGQKFEVGAPVDVLFVPSK